MFFRTRSVEPPPTRSKPVQPPDADDALDALASVLRAFGDLALDTDVSEDRAADEQLGAQVGRLVSACQLNDTDALKREAEQVAVLVTDVVTRRRQREKDQLAVLTECVRLLRSELHDARA